MKMNLKISLALAAVGCICLFSAGYVIGTIQANRRTLSKAMDVIDTLKTPVQNLNAQDALAIVALAATPRWRASDSNGVEQYKRGFWVNITPHLESR